MEATSLNGNTAMHLAAWNGKTNVIRLLLDSGAYIDWKDSVEQTCLHLAAQRGHFETLEELLGRGADVYARDALGRTVLQLAKQSDRATCARLIELHISRLPVAHMNSEEIQNKKENVDASRPSFRNAKHDKPVVLMNGQPRLEQGGRRIEFSTPRTPSIVPATIARCEPLFHRSKDDNGKATAVRSRSSSICLRVTIGKCRGSESVTDIMVPPLVRILQPEESIQDMSSLNNGFEAFVSRRLKTRPDRVCI